MTAESADSIVMLQITEETDYITIRSNINPGNKIILDQ